MIYIVIFLCFWCAYLHFCISYDKAAQAVVNEQQLETMNIMFEKLKEFRERLDAKTP
jgi:flagellar basal body-associated protein FliL